MCDLNVNCQSTVCYINAIYKAMLMVTNPDIDSITEYVMVTYN